MRVVQKISVFLLLLLLAGMVHDVQHKLTDYEPAHSEAEILHENCLLAAQTVDLTEPFGLQGPAFTYAKRLVAVTAGLPDRQFRLAYLTRAPPVLI
ncbi:MAG: hypothetical protein ACON4J_06605 [Parvibaculales bacterium]